MTLNELKAAILENGTGIYFELNGKKCGVEPEVQDSVFTFTMWYGDSFKDYSDFDELLLDGFFDGKSIVDILDIIEPSLY